MNLHGKTFAGIVALALFGAACIGTAAAQVLTLHGNQATQQVTYGTTGGTLDPRFPVQVQHELDPSGSNVVRATYVTQDSLLINVHNERCLSVSKDVNWKDGLVVEPCRHDGSQTFRRVGERLEIAGRCVEYSVVRPGPHVIAATCNGGIHQRWLRLNDGAIRRASVDGCLTVDEPVTEEVIKVEQCYPGHAQQSFLATAP